MAAPLRTLAVKSAAWYGATRLGGQLLSWAITIVLARLLAPADYGLYAIALSILTVLELLQEFGLGTAIVQRQNLTRPQLNAVFWVITTTSMLLTVATFVAAGFISSFYATPELAWVLRIFCFTFLLNSIGIVPYSLLTKALDLRRRSLAEVLGNLASALVALGLAFGGWGIWALVLGQLARAVVLSTSLTIFAGWRPGLSVVSDGMRSVVTFGLRIAGTHVISNFSPTVTTFLMARLLGGGAVGLYAISQSLAEAPHRISTAIINQISFPVFSRLQQDREELSRYYLKISRYLAMVSLPVQAGLVLVAPDLVPALLSAKWKEMVVPFQLICIENAVVVLTLTGTPLLTALGRGNLLFARALIGIALTTAAALLGAQFGLVGVAVARIVALVPLRLTLLIPCHRALELPMSEYFGSLMYPLIATVSMGLAVYGVQEVLLAGEGHVYRLIGSVLTGCVVYPAVLVLCDRGVTGEARILTQDLLSSRKA